MELSRQNLALIGVAAAAVVLGVGIVMANMHIAKDVQQALDDRSSLSKRLVQLNTPVDVGNRGSIRINAKIVEMEQRRVEDVQAALNVVIQDCSDWNHRNFQVLATAPQNGGTPAFPVDRDAFRRGLFRYDLTKAYIEAVNSLLAPLLPAEEISREQLEQEIPTWEQSLAASQQYEDLGDDRAVTINVDARQRARDSLVARSIRGCLIYANIDALDRKFDQPQQGATVEQIWHAQVSLWTMQDIVQAIRLTNEAAVAHLPSPTVVDSAVKRLVSIRLQGYATETSTPSITRRICSAEYDVIRYNFEVIMPIRYVDDLERALMSLNYHTIINVSMAAVHVPIDSLYDYGPDPVMKVSFDGELLLLTSWERGTWDAQSGDWSLDQPPLMPREILRTLPASAIREEDRERLR